jgi:hypothetical protein
VQADKEELQHRTPEIQVDWKDGSKLAQTVNDMVRSTMCDLLPLCDMSLTPRLQVGPTPAYGCWLSILRDLLSIPGATDAGYVSSSCTLTHASFPL